LKPTSALVVAIENYEQHPKREEVAVAASALVQALATSSVPDDSAIYLKDGTSQELRKQILWWMRDAADSDRLLLYWSGHGQRESDGLYLITQESPRHNLNTDNAVDPRSFAKGAANSKAKKVLIVFDACFSGEAVAEMAKTISDDLSGQVPSSGSRRGIAVFASAHALQFAKGGTFQQCVQRPAD
jgi:uncharacterized caspase-like protein